MWLYRRWTWVRRCTGRCSMIWTFVRSYNTVADTLRVTVRLASIDIKLQIYIGTKSNVLLVRTLTVMHRTAWGFPVQIGIWYNFQYFQGRFILNENVNRYYIYFLLLLNNKIVYREILEYAYPRVIKNWILKIPTTGFDLKKF